MVFVKLEFTSFDSWKTLLDRKSVRISSKIEIFQFGQKILKSILKDYAKTLVTPRNSQSSNFGSRKTVGWLTNFETEFIREDTAV